MTNTGHNCEGSPNSTATRTDEGIQSKTRRKKFEWHKWIMQDVVEKVHTV